MTKKISVGNLSIGGGQTFAVIAGPCVIESRDLCLKIGETAKAVCDKMGVPYVFKASFDKANRMSHESFRGPGLEAGLKILSEVKEVLGVPVLTDVHEVWQVEPTAAIADIIQIPAFLCRQTDLLIAAAQTGKPINWKKGQFIAPNDAKAIIAKAESTGNTNLMLTERGSSFGYNYLVVDMTSLVTMRSFGYPVIFDATHSVQRPGGLGKSSGGAREFVAPLVRAATAVGIDGLFLEVHPNPESAKSDAASMLPLGDLESVLVQAKKIEEALNQAN